MDKELILTLYVKLGRPLIHLGPGENCFDLELLLEPGNPLMQRHCDAIMEWYEKNSKAKT